MPIVPFRGKTLHSSSAGDHAHEVRLLCRQMVNDIRRLAATTPNSPEESFEKIERIARWVHRLTMSSSQR